MRCPTYVLKCPWTLLFSYVGRGMFGNMALQFFKIPDAGFDF